MDAGSIKISSIRIKITPVNDTVWMTKHQIADLFEVFVSKVRCNILSILKSGVLCESEVCRIYHYKNGNFVEQYNLEMIIAVSFRIKSRNSEVFRRFIIEKFFRKENTTRLTLPLHIMDINNLN